MAIIVPEVRKSPTVSRRRRLRDVLSDERWYQDGPPTWRNAPDAAAANRAQKAIIKRLRRFGKQDAKAAKLAVMLDNCASQVRCLRGACALCQRAFKRWMVDQVHTIATGKGDLTPVAMSIIVPGGRAPLGRLGRVKAHEFIRRAVSAIKAANNVVWAIGGIDVSLNDDTARHIKIGWQLQIYLVGAAAGDTNLSLLSERVRRDIGKVSAVLRPVKVRALDGSRYGISYILKTMFVRRVAYRSQVRGAMAWNTRKVELKAAQHVELLLFLDELGLTQRLLFYRIRGWSLGGVFRLDRRSIPGGA
jgi:hypothetical protein